MENDLFNEFSQKFDSHRLSHLLTEFPSAKPFPHIVIDQFFPEKLAKQLEEEFLPYDHPYWHVYDNPLENKKTLNNWNLFGPLTYKVLAYLNSPEFLSFLEPFVGKKVYPDIGLNGGGWHIHGNGGNLNPHLDYSIHPKLGLQRKLNLIVYLSSELRPEHGGQLGLWEHDSLQNLPGKLLKEIDPVFNRAILFDTTQNSWHGMSRVLSCPAGVYRKSLAVYYLVDPPSEVERRYKALFAPREEQKNDHQIMDLCKKRATLEGAGQVYITKS